MNLSEVTLAVPYYRNCEMLIRQVEKWRLYSDELRIIVVDDGSPEPAEPIIREHASPELLARIALYRILVDVEWNREEARNLASLQCETHWLIHVDIDHLLPGQAAEALEEFEPDPKHFYRFPRWRRGKADETRKKDAISPEETFGRIHPHIDSYLIAKDLYWQAGGYDLEFSGCLGGGTDFLKRLEAIAVPKILPDEIMLHVYTRSEVKDASDWSLSRDRTEGKRRMKAKQAAGTKLPKKTIVSPWERVL